MTRFTLCMVARVDRRAAAIQLLRSLVGPAEAHPNCLTCRVYVDAACDRSLCLLQEWDSQADLDKYLVSESSDRILDAIDLSEQAPIFRIDTVTIADGLDYLVSIRQRNRKDNGI